MQQIVRTGDSLLRASAPMWYAPQPFFFFRLQSCSKEMQIAVHLVIVTCKLYSHWQRGSLCPTGNIILTSFIFNNTTRITLLDNPVTQHHNIDLNILSQSCFQKYWVNTPAEFFWALYFERKVWVFPADVSEVRLFFELFEELNLDALPHWL